MSIQATWDVTAGRNMHGRHNSGRARRVAIVGDVNLDRQLAIYLERTRLARLCEFLKHVHMVDSIRHEVMRVVEVASQAVYQVPSLRREERSRTSTRTTEESEDTTVIYKTVAKA